MKFSRPRAENFSFFIPHSSRLPRLPFFATEVVFWHLQAAFCSLGRLRPSFFGSAQALLAAAADFGRLEPSFLLLRRLRKLFFFYTPFLQASWTSLFFCYGSRIRPPQQYIPCSCPDPSYIPASFPTFSFILQDLSCPTLDAPFWETFILFLFIIAHRGVGIWLSEEIKSVQNTFFFVLLSRSRILKIKLAIARIFCVC